MSSRWDALRGDNNDKKKERYRQKGRPKQNFPSRNNQDRAQAKHANPSRKDFNHGSSTRPKDWVNNRSNEQNDEKFRLTTLKWEKLTKLIWELGNQTHDPSPLAGRSNNDNEFIHPGEEKSEMWGILHQLSTILETQETQKVIDGKQRGDAISAACNLLNSYNDKGSIREVLSWICKTFELSSRLIQQMRIQMTTVQAQKSIQGLLHGQSFLDDAMTRREHLKCCIYLTKSCAQQMPAEQTALQVVGKIMLPAMDVCIKDLASSSNSMKPDSPAEILLLSLQALHGLLQDKNQSSALLAPLVNDVSSEGNEIYLSNQIRKRIFLMLQNALQVDFAPPQKDIQKQVYLCFEKALQAACAVDKSISSHQSGRGSSGKSVTDADVSIMEKVFQRNLQSRRNKVDTSCRKDNLRLLMALLQYHPGAALSIGRILLLPEFSSSSAARDFGAQPSGNRKADNLPMRTCLYCKEVSTSIFIATIHDSKDPEDLDLGVASLAMLVKNISWKLWLGKKNLPTQRRGNTTSNFLQRVNDIILSILTVTKCEFLSLFCSSESEVTMHKTHSILDLVKTSLLDIPYGSLYVGTNVKQSPVIEAASGLFKALADMLLRENRFHHPLHGGCCELFEECMGGRTTPQGTRTETIIPAAVWLSSTSLRSFLACIFDSLLEGAKHSNQQRKEVPMRTSTRVFRAMLSTKPELAHGNKNDWSNFQQLTQALIESKNFSFQHCGLQLLDGFHVGRKHSSAPAQDLAREEVVAFTLRLLPQVLKQQSSGACRCLCFQVYGSLLGHDWFLHENVIKPHLDFIMPYCGGTEPPSLRSAACKCVGDICSNCFLPSENGGWDVRKIQQRDDTLKLIAQDVCTTLLSVLKDGNAVVRSMAIFALGNLAQVLSCCTGTCLGLNPDTVREACLAVFGCMDDDSDKVSGNAIRCLGHFGALILRPLYSASMIHSVWDVDEFCLQLVRALVQRVETVNVIVGTKRSELSWKQRSAAKKHGRVACNSLVLILKHWTVTDGNTDSIRKALASAVKCLDFYNTSMDDKFITAAMAVLRALPPSSLAKVSGKQCIVGNAIVPCLSFMAQERWHRSGNNHTGSRMLDDVEELSKHLLESATIADVAVVVISCEEIEGHWIEDLYEWMVTNHCSARTFDVFAIALQRPGMNISVAVENKFANRAMNLFRHDGLNEPDSDDEL